ncbi:WD-REPEATS-REGION domain-containing protein [Mycena indigotica]|uniref:WD-REPEATS-REGION domain-containing protein n=1 Tax=Mycena indigotica TaxID=2126181 RepID=A0A8H6WES8_9AGAR|nr:WD-REPEATS-REGION domain-containing protein [Mycena indigotica]KAF7309789.1 WD-REPEATS-REGION domain-containing protein [Mycena indigotica]
MDEAGDILTPQQCSVRGCSKVVEVPTDPLARKPPKMCLNCRGKHRQYADSKRARRKAEKALIVGLSDGSLPLEPTPTKPAKTLLEQYPELLASLTLAERAKPKRVNKTAIVPASPSTTSEWPILYNPSSSSTLAGALGEPTPPPIPQLPLPPVETSADEKPRYCSVKGCKVIIVESIVTYPYKMCQSCRNRYRVYGVTKRKKSKTARAEHDRELKQLLDKEDERRANEGLAPLTECPEELEAYQQALVDAQSALPLPHQALTHGKPQVIMPPPDPRFVRPTLASSSSSPLRVCSVSHCHKILLGSYRFKRCEVHRQQNRMHSFIKRGRELIQKGILAEDGTVLIQPGPIKAPKSSKGKERANSEALPATSVEDDDDNQVIQPTPISKRNTKSNKDPAICKQDGCCNLIMPGTRWRTCTNCKAKWNGSRSAPSVSTDTSEIILENPAASEASFQIQSPPLSPNHSTSIPSVDEGPSGNRSWTVQTPETRTAVPIAASPLHYQHTQLPPSTPFYPFLPSPFLPAQQAMVLVPVSVPRIPNYSHGPPPVQYYTLTPAPAGYLPQPQPSSSQTEPTPTMSVSASAPAHPPVTEATPDRKTVFVPQSHPPPPNIPGRPYSRTSNEYVHYQFENGQPVKKRRFSAEQSEEQGPDISGPAGGIIDFTTNEDVVAQRRCGNHSCHRILPIGAASSLCDKCRSRMKKRQAVTKQRFRLEPKKVPQAAVSSST